MGLHPLYELIIFDGQPRPIKTNENYTRIWIVFYEFASMPMADALSYIFNFFHVSTYDFANSNSGS